MSFRTSDPAARQIVTEPDPLSAEGMLRALSGGVLDLGQLGIDAEALFPFVRFQQKLWAVELATRAPAPVFSASWEDLDYPTQRAGE